MTVREALAALVAMLGVGCAALAFSQGQKADPSKALVKNARIAATVAGSTVTLEARIWADLMPGPGSRPPPVRVAANLLLVGEAHQGKVSVSRLWLVPSNEEPIEVPITSSQATQEGARAAGAVRFSRHLPKKGWVVAEVRTPTGSFFIRSTETSIHKVY